MPLSNSAESLRVWHGILQLDITCGVAMASVGYRWDIYLTEDITYKALTYKLWNMCCDYFSLYKIWTESQEVRFFHIGLVTNQSWLMIVANTLGKN